MTTKDNQIATISIKMTTQTANGVNWEGSVQLEGPLDEEMVAQALSLSEQLAQQAATSGDTVDVAEIVKALPNRPKTRRTPAVVEPPQPEPQDAGVDLTEEIEKIQAEIEAGTFNTDGVDSMQTLAPPTTDELPF